MGVRDKTLIDHLCHSPKLLLDETRLQARIHEREDAARARDTLFTDTPNATPGHVVTEAWSKASEGQQRSGKLSSHQKSVCTGTHAACADKPCCYYGRSPHPHANCSARDVTCSHCNGKGHASEKVCVVADTQR